LERSFEELKRVLDQVLVAVHELFTLRHRKVETFRAKLEDEIEERQTKPDLS
jgi:hypothetical protein